MNPDDVFIWAWCELFHRKHHEHIGLYRECRKCGNWVVRRDKQAEKAERKALQDAEVREFEQSRARIRSLFEQPKP